MSKTPAADRSHGGPGSSKQDADHPHEEVPARDSGGHSNTPPVAGSPTNPNRSETSGGGGERDKNHTHDPRTKR